jgi:hypothetical protein
MGIVPNIARIVEAKPGRTISRVSLCLHRPTRRKEAGEPIMSNGP